MKNYWLSKNYGNSDPYECNNIKEVTKVLKTSANDILKEQGYVAGGYIAYYKNYDEISNGEFRLEDDKAVYYPDFIEKQYK